MTRELIDKQDAIDTVYKSVVGKPILTGYRDLIITLKELPSVQVECQECDYTLIWLNGYEKGKQKARLEQQEIIHCKDCKYWEEYRDGCSNGYGLALLAEADDFCSQAE